MGLLTILVQKKNFSYLCDEIAAGTKSTDHTISFLEHYVNNYLDEWVRHLTICLDNARICKNCYILSWTSELVDNGKFDSVRFIYMVAGHTKFHPDQLFSSISKTYSQHDVFCIEMLADIAKHYSTTHIMSSKDIRNWKISIEEKYDNLPGITGLHDFLVKKEAENVVIHHKTHNYSGLYDVCSLKKATSIQFPLPTSYNSIPLSNEKMKHLIDQYDKYIKVDVSGYVQPTFLPPPALTGAQIQNSNINTGQKKNGCVHCDGSGNVPPGR